ncbi:MAG: sulfatase, partial [Acidobacteriota bacterium]
VDERPLALAIEEIGLLAPGQSPRQARAAGEPPAILARRDALRLTASGSYLVPLAVPRDAEALSVSVETKGRGARVRASLVTIEGNEETAFLATDGRQRIDLADHRGRDITLVFDVDLPRRGHIDLIFPRLETSTATPDTPQTVTGGARSTPSERPDIVLVVLDAARADHFGAYGYSRDTSPEIDRLADRSLVFRDVLAECPYTACSMPNLLAGLSFPQHGVVAHGLQLADRVDTLAEVLSQVGYRTLGITGNPNSSRLTGSDQGFDEFLEIWRLTSGRDRTHPEFLTRLAIDRLEQLDERPLFLLLHYVPPHEPYDPDPAFDLFGDPDYAGPVIGEQRFVQSIFAREIELDEADLQELIALYDGNLHMADYWVGRLIETLKRLGRWDNTLFVLTSDHGEAFDEHGFLGHNDTIHQEMLHVPLILRLPADERPEGADLERLASLGDVVPTILARLDRPTPVGAQGTDLLAPPTVAAADHLVVLRSAHEAGVLYGVRTPRFKLLAREPASWDPGGFQLFDLVTDPGETQDLAPQRRLLQATLALRLERALQQSVTAAEDPEPAAISPEDEEMLRSLGYLNP